MTIETYHSVIDVM